LVHSVCHHFLLPLLYTAQFGHIFTWVR